MKRKTRSRLHGRDDPGPPGTHFVKKERNKAGLTRFFLAPSFSGTILFKDSKA